MTRKSVGILIFDEVEVLDFAGPFEVFSVAGQRQGDGAFDVYTIAEVAGTILARNGLQVIPDKCFADDPHPEILVIPGGYGTRALLEKPHVIDWIAARSAQAELTLSVCTGSLLLAKAGLLDGLKATSHWGALDLLGEIAPGVAVQRDTRVVDNGDIVTAAGVAAGIDMAFHIVARLLGNEAAEEAAHYIEYPWQPSQGLA